MHILLHIKMWSLWVLPMFLAVSSAELTSLSTGCHLDKIKSKASCSSVGMDEFIYFTKRMYNAFKTDQYKFDFYIQDVRMSNELLITTVSGMSNNLKKLRIVNNITTSDAALFQSLSRNNIQLDLSNNRLREFPTLCPAQFAKVTLSHNSFGFLNRTGYCDDFNYSEFSLDLSQCNITHIGKDAFSLTRGSLQNLNLSRNEIKSLNSSLRNTHVEVLDLSYNKLEYLFSSEFSQVSVLLLTNNQLFAINFNYSIYHQRISKMVLISVANIGNINNSLINLKLDQNQYNYDSGINNIDIISVHGHVIPPYAFQLPDRYKYFYSDLTINIIKAAVFQLSPDTFNGLQNVKILNINYQNIRKLENFTFRNSKHSMVNMSASQIQIIEPQAFENSSIDTLILRYNNLTEIDLDVFRDVQEVDLSHNLIHTIHPSTCGSQTIKYNNLVLLNMSFNAIDVVGPDFARGLEYLRVLDLSNNRLAQLSDKVFWPLVNLEWLSLKKNAFDTFNSTAFSFESHKLKSIAFSSNNSITKNQFARFDSLVSLNITNSRIKVLHSGSFNGLYSLNSIVTRNVTVDSIEPNAFADLNKLTDVNFSDLLKYQTVLKNGTFSGLSSLRNLDITHTNITYISCGAFTGLEYLLSLSLSYNKIRNCARGAFKDLHNLVALDLSHNALRGISLGIFDGLDGLETLDLSHNKLHHFDAVANGVFKSLQHLKMLNLTYNSLEFIHSGMFGGLRALTTLDLSHTNLQRLSTVTLFPMRYLINLNVSHNTLDKLEDYITFKENNVYLNSIALNGNMFSCSYLFTLLQYFRHNNIEYDSDNFTISNLDGVSCRQRFK